MLPLLVDPTDRIRQNTGPVASPEQNLAMAVILAAIEDLNSKDETHRFEAHEFFLQPKGPWADMRRFYFEACGLDDAYLLKHLSARLDPPERPDRKWTYREVLEILPRDRAFNCPDESKKTSLHTSQFNTRVQFLINTGDVVRLEPGLFCVTEFEATYRAEQQRRDDAQRERFQLDEPEEPIDLGGKTRHQNLVLNALLDGPLTCREIQIKTGTGTHDMLRGMILNGLLEKEGTKFRLVPQSVVAA